MLISSDFLILFFTEALFYCGVAVFLLLVDHLRRPALQESAANSSSIPAPQLGQRVSSVATLVLSLIIPMVTMGLVWPWTGPAASATLAPYLVGIIVQFAFEQYARYKKSPSWPVIPVIFQVSSSHSLFQSFTAIWLRFIKKICIFILFAFGRSIDCTSWIEQHSLWQHCHLQWEELRWPLITWQ